MTAGAPIRFDDRVSDGKKTLHIAEVQSDWHQEGKRKGYQGHRRNTSAIDSEIDAIVVLEPVLAPP